MKNTTQSWKIPVTTEQYKQRIEDIWTCGVLKRKSPDQSSAEDLLQQAVLEAIEEGRDFFNSKHLNTIADRQYRHKVKESAIPIPNTDKSMAECWEQEQAAEAAKTPIDMHLAPQKVQDFARHLKFGHDRHEAATLAGFNTYDAARKAMHRVISANENKIQ